jgi:predicted RNA-binding protein Jag
MLEVAHGAHACVKRSVSAKTEDTVAVEGNTLEDALQEAVAVLGVPRSLVEFEYDRDHLASGATTVRVFARKRVRGPRTGDQGEAGDRGRRGPRPIDRNSPEIKERDEKLRTRARELVEKVNAGEGRQSIPELNSYERHLVHTIAAEAGLASHSEGEALRKTIYITKK